VGDDALTVRDRTALIVRERYLEVNGDHPMTPVDDAYVRAGFVPATDEQLALMAEGRMPLPPYLLSDGTAMVPADHDDLARFAGGVEHLHDWFVAFWTEDAAAGEEAWEHYLLGRYAHLAEVSPVTIRRTARAVALAEGAAARLREDRRDHLARGQLGECVDGVPAVPGLDAQLRPMCSYDRARYGGPTLRERLVDALREEFFTFDLPSLPLHTERLVLRARRLEDADAFAPAWADEDYARHLLTGTMNAAEVRETIRRRMAGSPGNRTLGLVVEHEGQPVGDTVLFLQGTGWSQAEIGWTVLPAHSGRGYATEAARAVLALAFEHYGVHRVVATLDGRNARSAAVCERLGMRLECDKRADFWSKGEWTPTLEYALLAEEWAGRRTPTTDG
jgi:RimJ/RimL family protein N-acetyltransferase